MVRVITPDGMDLPLRLTGRVAAMTGATLIRFPCCWCYNGRLKNTWLRLVRGGLGSATRKKRGPIITGASDCHRGDHRAAVVP